MGAVGGAGRLRLTAVDERVRAVGGLQDGVGVASPTTKSDFAQRPPRSRVVQPVPALWGAIFEYEPINERCRIDPALFPPDGRLLGHLPKCPSRQGHARFVRPKQAGVSPRRTAR